MNNTKVISHIREIFNTSENFIPLHAPMFKGNEKAYLENCIDTTFVSSVGKYVDGFEQKLQTYTSIKKAVVCVNGTNSIHLCLEIVGVKPGDEVITQALTFIATANAICYAQAKPVFVDVDKDTMGMSPNALQHFLENNTEIRNDECYNKTSGNRIKACLPMHTFGHACRIKEIAIICSKYNIELVEDAAEAMGSFYEGRHLGNFGKMAAISFNGNKIMTTGGGGAILTNDESLAKKAKYLTTQAKVPHPWEYSHDEIGYNYRMPNINAALGLAQMEQLDFFLERKRVLAMNYKAFFESENIVFFDERPGEKCNFWLNAIILKNREEREEFLKKTNEKGVMTRPIWTLMSKLPMFKNCQHDGLQNSEWLEERVVNIPSSVI
ncbi:LegC family aminotransferase [Flavobacterium tibetense]|uniref:GDP-perosamine synthase n=1 Tax=Flavobacterium tibetense TaxID=2233533 RepID=A0A365P3K4_9FLAO|nr:LegC family aminotransferase [Flavobacterium tibetense]RBA29126.1 LegC family aminotransferase [Flavobacterium tibetense]